MPDGLDRRYAIHFFFQIVLILILALKYTWKYTAILYKNNTNILYLITDYLFTDL